MEALWTEWCMFGRIPRKNSEGKHRAQGLRSARTVLFLVLPIPIFLEKICTSGRTLAAPGCGGATQTVATGEKCSPNAFRLLSHKIHLQGQPGHISSMCPHKLYCEMNSWLRGSSEQGKRLILKDCF